MLYEVTNQNYEIDFAPADETAEILQNVRTILLTEKGTCPLYREFGINSGLLDFPISIAQNKIAAELATQISIFEPRCKLQKVTCTPNLDGTLKISCFIEI